MTTLLTNKQMIRFRNTAKRTKLVFGELHLTDLIKL